METTLTVKQAAEALGISPRTLRRRLQAGDLSYTRTPRGNREVLTVDAAELARFAQVHGYTLRQPGAEAGGTEGQEVANRAEAGGTEGHEVAQRAGAAGGTEWQTVANRAEAGGTEGKQGQLRAEVGGTEWQTVAQRAGMEGQAPAVIASLQAQIQALTQERDFLREVVLRLTTKRLPPAEEERRPSWWQRLLGQRGEKVSE